MSAETASVNLSTARPKALTLGLGTIVTDNYGAKNPEGFADLLASAAGAGITTIDTAAAYGHGESERLVGQYMEALGLRFRICTKIGMVHKADADGHARYVSDARPDSLWRQAEASLKRLRCSQVDYLLLHRPDPNIPIERAMESMATIRDAGLAKRIGFSNVSNAEATRVLNERTVDIVQYPWSLLDSRRTKLLETAERAGVERMAFGVLAFGILAGSVTRNATFEDDDWRGIARSGRDPGTTGATLFLGDAFLRAVSQAENFERSAQSAGFSLAAATIAASLAVAPAELIIVGCRNARELDGLIEGTGKTLPEAVIAQARKMAIV